MNKRTIKNACEFIFCCFPCEILLEEIKFSVANGYKLQLASEIEMGHVFTSDSSTSRKAKDLHLLPQSLTGLMCISPVDSRSLFLSSSSGFPDPLEEEFDGDILFRSECFNVVHALHIVWLVVSIFFLSIIRGSFYNDVKAMH